MSRSILANVQTFAFAVSLVFLAACGSTSYDISKTIVYKGQIYQVTDTKQISPRIEAVVDKETINLQNKDKGEISDLISANDPLYVRMAFDLDEQELVYVATDVDSYRDYNRLLSRFENAGDDIAKLMAERKTKQLKLR